MGPNPMANGLPGSLQNGPLHSQSATPSPGLLPGKPGGPPGGSPMVPSVRSPMGPPGGPPVGPPGGPSLGGPPSRLPMALPGGPPLGPPGGPPHGPLGGPPNGPPGGPPHGPPGRTPQGTPGGPPLGPPGGHLQSLPGGPPQGPPRGSPQGPTGGPPQGSPGGHSQGLPGGPPQGLPGGPPQSLPGGPPQGLPGGPPQGLPGGPPQGLPGGPPQGLPGGPPQGLPGGPPQGLPGGPPQGLPGGPPQDLPGGPPQGLPGGPPQGLPGGPPQGLPGGPSQGLPGGPPQVLPGGPPQGLPGGPPQGLPGGPPQGLPGGPPQGLPGGPPQGLPGGPPQGLPGGPTLSLPGGPMQGPLGGLPAQSPTGTSHPGFPSGPPTSMQGGPAPGPPMGPPGGPPVGNAGGPFGGLPSQFPGAPSSSSAPPTSGSVASPGMQPGIPTSSIAGPGGMKPNMPPSSMAGPPMGMHQNMPPTSMGPPGRMQQGYPPTSMGSGPGMPPPPSHGMGQPPDSGMPPVNGTGGMKGRYPGAQAPPPASSGSYPGAPQGPRRLNPDDMPSPLQVMEEDQRCRSGEFFTNMKGQVPPLVTTDFTVRDGGNSSPEYIRSTMYSIPHTPDMLKQTNVPFSIVLSPMAEVPATDSPLYVGTSLTNGPVRCNRCKGYMSPLMQFMDGGQKYQCKLCRGIIEVPREYFCHMDGQGSRADRYQRAELCCGTYEYIATAEYCREKTLPKEPAFIFIFEMTQLMMQRGIIQLLCQNMKEIIQHLPRDTVNGVQSPESNIQIGFITYDSNVHFYKLDGQSPEMCVMCDRDEMFVPLSGGILCDAKVAAENIDKLMETIPENFVNTRETSGVMGCAIRAGMEALKASGRVGKMFVFHSSLPAGGGHGGLKMREDRKLLGTEKEKSILTPQTTYYNNLGQDMVAVGGSVDIYMFNDSYVDLASIGQAARLTGGQVYKYAFFQSNRDGPRLLEDLKLNIGRQIGFDAVMRVRTSQGVRPVEFFGHFFMSNTTDIELASIDSSKGIAVEIKHDDKITDEDGVYIQAALLYTSCSGQRRLRIINLALSICSQMADLYKNCDLDTLMNFFGKQAVARLLESSAKQVKENLISRTANILACYRKNCASPSSAGQLILPEMMKLLPLYINCLNRCDAVSGGQDITCDERSLQMYTLTAMTVDMSVVYFYPRLIPLSDDDPQ
ncbi:Protein transport protein Sec24C, partial [Halocaridina rubra]